jgi:hypothetical protein
MHRRAAELIDRLALQPHPEGGFYREIFRSARRVRPEDARPARDAIRKRAFILRSSG